MKHLRFFSLLPALTVLAISLGHNTPNAQAQSVPTATFASSVDAEVSAIEKQILDVAEAMPEDKFNFTPENLNISGSDYRACAASQEN
jgi:hypothetical protein